MERLPLDALALEVRTGVVEVKEHGALPELLDEELGTLLGRDLYVRESQTSDISSASPHPPQSNRLANPPLKAGSFSSSTDSETWNRLLRCFLGVLPTIGIVSFGPTPPLSRLRGPPLGGVPPPTMSSWAGGGTEPAPPAAPPPPCGMSLTTTIGGAGEVLSAGDDDELLRSGVDGGCCCCCCCWEDGRTPAAPTPAEEDDELPLPPPTRLVRDAMAGVVEGMGGMGLLPLARGALPGADDDDCCCCCCWAGEVCLASFLELLESLDDDLLLESWWSPRVRG